MVYESNILHGVFGALELLNESEPLVEDYLVKGENQDREEELLDYSAMVIELYKPLEGEYVIPKCILGDLEDLAEYVDEFINGTPKEFNYTYHNLYGKYLDRCLSEIERYRYTRRAVLPLAGDVSYESQYPPCLQEMIPRIVCNVEGKERLDLMAIFRSNDAVKAFPMNIFAIAMFQKQLAERLNVPVGCLTYVVNSFHCYKADIPKLNKYIERYEAVVYQEAAPMESIGFTMEEYYEAESEYKRKKQLREESEQTNQSL